MFAQYIMAIENSEEENQVFHFETHFILEEKHISLSKNKRIEFEFEC